MQMLPVDPFTNIDKLYTQHEKVTTCPVKCGMELLIHS